MGQLIYSPPPTVTLRLHIRYTYAVTTVTPVCPMTDRYTDRYTSLNRPDNDLLQTGLGLV